MCAKNRYETINEVFYCTLMSEVNVENTNHIGRKLKEEYPTGLWFLLEPLRNLDLIFFKIKHYYI